MNITSKKRKYDVVILTHAPKDELITSIKKLINQYEKPNKIIIYNTDKKRFYENITKRDELKTLIKSLKNDKILLVHHIKEKKFDHGKTRNEASKLCKSDYILFMTDDAVPYDLSMVTNLLNGFDGDNICMVYARQIAKDNAKLKEKIVREFNYPDDDITKDLSTEKIYGIKNYYCSNVCAMYERKIFKELGRFEKNVILNEDTFYVYKALRYGYKYVYKSDAMVLHSHNYTYIDQFKRNFDIGVSQCEKKDIFDKINSVDAGKSLAKSVICSLLKQHKILETIDFIIECGFRFMGYKIGYNYERLGKRMCLLCATNKNYFIKKFDKMESMKDTNVNQRYNKK